MNVYVFSDESGVFDVMHNEYYVYGGLIFLDRESKDRCTRKYLSIERMIRQNSDYAPDAELKACRITNHEKYKLYKSLKNCIISFMARAAVRVWPWEAKDLALMPSMSISRSSL